MRLLMFLLCACRPSRSCWRLRTSWSGCEHCWQPVAGLARNEHGCVAQHQKRQRLAAEIQM
jgi:hypothetical protein